MSLIDTSDDRFACEDYSYDYRREARETRARIASDMQAIISQVEEIALGWAADGLLDTKRTRQVWCKETRQWALVPYQIDRLRASSELAQTIKDALHDALSATAVEMLEDGQ